MIADECSILSLPLLSICQTYIAIQRSLNVGVHILHGGLESTTEQLQRMKHINCGLVPILPLSFLLGVINNYHPPVYVPPPPLTSPLQTLSQQRPSTPTPSMTSQLTSFTDDNDDINPDSSHLVQSPIEIPSQSIIQKQKRSQFVPHSQLEIFQLRLHPYKLNNLPIGFHYLPQHHIIN